jgi:hypothetical protein
MQNNMLQEGQEILEGRFKIMKKLGCGAFGEIFKGKVFIIKARSTGSIARSQLFTNIAKRVGELLILKNDFCLITLESGEEEDWRVLCS